MMDHQDGFGKESRVKTYHKSNLDHTKLLDHTHRSKGYFTGSMECQITEDPIHKRERPEGLSSSVNTNYVEFPYY